MLDREQNGMEKHCIGIDRIERWNTTGKKFDMTTKTEHSFFFRRVWWWWFVKMVKLLIQVYARYVIFLSVFVQGVSCGLLVDLGQKPVYHS